jgi:hypothetical protein
MKDTIMLTFQRIVFCIIVSICLSFSYSTAMATNTIGVISSDISPEIEDISYNIEETCNLAQNGIDLNWQFYYQLNDLEKLIYEGFEKNREVLIKGEECSFTIATYTNTDTINIKAYKDPVITAMRAFLADNPVEKIWMDYCKLSIHQVDNMVALMLKPQGSIDAQSATETFERRVSEFVKTLSGTDLEKLQAIHNWLIENVEYDLTTTNNGNVYGAVVEGHSVCSGFAYSFKYLSNKAGLNVVYVQGYYHSSKSDTYTYHAWNMAKVDSEWLLIDVTFDGSLGISSLFSWQDFGLHLPDSRFTYPN